MLALDGRLLPARVAALHEMLNVHLVSADTYGMLVEVAEKVVAEAIRLQPGGEAEQKAAFLRHTIAGRCSLSSACDDGLQIRR